MWSPKAFFDPETLREGVEIHHLDGNPPRRFVVSWPRDATLVDVIDALDQLLTDLFDYLP